MNRREFISLLGGVTLCFPRAQADRIYRIGYLSLGSPAAPLRLA
jgi:hypothetical protein